LLQRCKEWIAFSESHAVVFPWKRSRRVLGRIFRYEMQRVLCLQKARIKGAARIGYSILRMKSKYSLPERTRAATRLVLKSSKVIKNSSTDSLKTQLSLFKRHRLTPSSGHKSWPLNTVHRYVPECLWQERGSACRQISYDGLYNCALLRG
jgi:hypothetical protein